MYNVLQRLRKRAAFLADLKTLTLTSALINSNLGLSKLIYLMLMNLVSSIHFYSHVKLKLYEKNKTIKLRRKKTIKHF